MPTISVAGDLTVDWTIVVPAGSSTHLAAAFAWERSCRCPYHRPPGRRRHGPRAPRRRRSVGPGAQWQQPSCSISPDRQRPHAAGTGHARPSRWQHRPFVRDLAATATHDRRRTDCLADGPLPRSARGRLQLRWAFRRALRPTFLSSTMPGMDFARTSGVADMLRHQGQQPRRVIVKMAGPSGRRAALGRTCRPPG